MAHRTSERRPCKPRPNAIAHRVPSRTAIDSRQHLSLGIDRGDVSPGTRELRHRDREESHAASDAHASGSATDQHVQYPSRVPEEQPEGIVECPDQSPRADERLALTS